MEIKRVIGTGDPFDVVFMVPLVHQTHASRACTTETGDPCEAPIARIVILAAPITDDNGVSNDILAYCERHFQSLIARSKSVARGPAHG